MSRSIDEILAPELVRVKDKLSRKKKGLLDDLTEDQLQRREAYILDMQATQEVRAARNEELRIEELRMKWNAPKDHVHAQVCRDGKFAQWAEKEARVKSMLFSGCIVGLIGANGPGKTQLAVECMKTVTEEGLSAYYDWSSGFFLRIRAAYHPKSDVTEEEALGFYLKPKLLVIDEFEKRSSNDWEQRLLFFLLDRRFSDHKDTILIANCTVPEFGNLVGRSVQSRMSQSGGVIQFNWKSFRGPKELPNQGENI